ncbi:alpha/beta hydrolase [soil metagenome]
MVVDINLTPTASHIQIERAQKAVDGTSELGKPLPARTWGTATECVAGAILVHGLGAHSGWFEALGRRLRIRRIYSIAYDQVGFGKRKDEEFTSYNQWLDDLETAFAYARNTIGDKPLYIMGNSMGAVISVRALSDRRVDPTGLVMFSPGFDGHPEVFTMPFRIKALWQALTAPESEVILPYSPELVTRDLGVRNWILNDPERRFTVPARMLLELLKITNDLGKRSKQIICPVVMFSAGIEKIVNPRASEKLFGGLTCVKDQHVYKEAWHDLMFDPVIDEMSDHLAAWISQTSKTNSKKVKANFRNSV